MDARSSLSTDARSLQITREEAGLLMLALQNVAIDLGEHERSLCGKVRDLWDEFHQPEPSPGAPASRTAVDAEEPARAEPRLLAACRQLLRPRRQTVCG